VIAEIHVGMKTEQHQPEGIQMRARFSLIVIGLLRSTHTLHAQNAVVPPQIATTATGESSVQPDRATILFAVETHAPTAEAARADNARRQTAVLEGLRGQGLTADQVSTFGFSVTPEMRYDGKESKIIGYAVRNTIRVDVRRLEQIGMIIDGALTRGANTVSSLRFASSKADDARRVALAVAVARAKADAEAMARAAGGSLGPLQELTNNQGSGPIAFEAAAMMPAAARAQADTPIVPGEQMVSVSISARWLFIPGR
jgi:uncharacterized protein YggE